MSSIDVYRTNAEDCLRMVEAAEHEQDRPLWATLAQSWLKLAEDADRIRSGQLPGDNDHFAEDYSAWRAE